MGQFGALRLDEAARGLEAAAALFDQLAPTVRREQAFVHMNLLRSRIELARKNPKGSSEAIAKAAEAAVDVELDEAEYPPQLRQAFQAAKAKVRSRPSRAARVESEPTNAEIEINGRLAGRTPALADLPPGRCFISVAKAGFRANLAVCPTEDKVKIALEPATREELRDQLRERLSTDPSWFLEPLLLETLATEEGARWIVVLDRDRAQGLKAIVYSAAEHAIKPVEPSRYAESELDKLSAVVSDLVLVSQRLQAQVVETPTGVPALEARSADPELGGAAAFVRRVGEPRWDRLVLAQQAPGRFTVGLPISLAVDGGWDVEFYAEAYDRGGALSGRAGEAARPLNYHRAPLIAAVAGPPSWYTRWYVWTAVAVVVAGGAATGTYFAVRSRDVSVTFWGQR